ncbi:MAG: peptidase S8 [Ignavibacteriae bacterium HGW-Ignavibacteriae-3]|nr:MAG: peptidase S8 [Ignavibacteriae bacterium HGW-Ignavibacteriae-3]
MRSFKIGVVKLLTLVTAMLMFGTSTFAQVSVTLPTVAGPTGSTATGAITVGSFTGVYAFQFTISYDKNVVDLTGVATAGTLIDGKDAPTVNADLTNGKLHVAWASATALTSTGALPLIKLNFTFKTGTTSLTFDPLNPFKLNAGTPAVTTTVGSAFVPGVLVQGGTVSNAVVGGTISIPVTVTSITDAQGVYSYDFTATFDKNVITLTAADVVGTLSAGGSPAININNTTGTVTFAYAGASKIVAATGGTLVKLTGTAVGAGTSALTFTSFKFNTGSPTSSASAGSVVVVAANVAPTLTVAATASVNEGQALALTLVGADTPGDVLTYSYTVSPAITLNMPTLNATTGAFAWTPDYSQSGVYTFTFKVTDQGALSATKTTVVTVVNVNRAPVFTATLPANVVVPVHKAPNPVYYRFTYLASDPDGQPLAFALLGGAANMSMTIDGAFSWAPALDQAGKSYVITVQVSDGSLTATTTSVITASATITSVEDYSGVPTEFSLMQNYPNPFNPTTSIRFALPAESSVKLSVFNMLGQEVATLAQGTMAAGFHKVDFDASKLNSGMYIYRIEAGNYVSVKKMVLMK